MGKSNVPLRCDVTETRQQQQHFLPSCHVFLMTSRRCDLANCRLVNIRVGLSIGDPQLAHDSVAKWDRDSRFQVTWKVKLEARERSLRVTAGIEEEEEDEEEEEEDEKEEEEEEEEMEVV